MKANTVLIVDDEPMARDIMEGFLFREGYNLVLASGGPEALDMIEEVNPDIILLDVMMPEMDGFNVCQTLKADDSKWRHVPIILVTALDQKSDLARGFEAGADDFLHKPVDDVELRARVRAMLRIKKQHDELQAALRLREDLAHMIVHDMRSPISAILGFSELLMIKGEGSESCLNEVEKIHGQALSLNSFLNDILVMAKMESGYLIVTRAPVNARELLKRVEQNHKVIAELKRINLVTDLPAERRLAEIDANLFQRVLDNLLSNALKFSPPNSSVTLRLEQLNSAQGQEESAAFQLRVTVLDEGPGVPEADRHRIFDKYEVVAMAQSEDSPYQAGLGLAFCKMVVEAHGGRIYVTDNHPTGAAFTVEI